jgi:hypothetical protein
MTEMRPPRSLRSLPPKGAALALGAALRAAPMPPRSLRSLPPKGAALALGAALRAAPMPPRSLRSQRAGFAQPARSAGAAHALRNPCLTPAKGAALVHGRLCTADRLRGRRAALAETPATPLGAALRAAPVPPRSLRSQRAGFAQPARSAGTAHAPRNPLVRGPALHSRSVQPARRMRHQFPASPPAEGAALIHGRLCTADRLRGRRAALAETPATPLGAALRAARHPLHPSPVAQCLPE